MATDVEKKKGELFMNAYRDLEKDPAKKRLLAHVQNNGDFLKLYELGAEAAGKDPAKAREDAKAIQKSAKDALKKRNTDSIPDARLKGMSNEVFTKASSDAAVAVNGPQPSAWDRFVSGGIPSLINSANASPVAPGPTAPATTPASAGTAPPVVDPADETGRIPSTPAAPPVTTAPAAPPVVDPADETGRIPSTPAAVPPAATGPVIPPGFDISGVPSAPAAPSAPTAPATHLQPQQDVDISGVPSAPAAPAAGTPATGLAMQDVDSASGGATPPASAPAMPASPAEPSQPTLPSAQMPPVATGVDIPGDGGGATPPAASTPPPVVASPAEPPQPTLPSAQMPPAPAPKPDTEYKVKSGDTVDALAYKHYQGKIKTGEDLLKAREAIARANGMDEKSVNNLKIGQTLKIPNSIERPAGAPKFDHKITDADTRSKLGASRHGSSGDAFNPTKPTVLGDGRIYNPATGEVTTPQAAPQQQGQRAQTGAEWARNQDLYRDPLNERGYDPNRDSYFGLKKGQLGIEFRRADTGVTNGGTPAVAEQPGLPGAFQRAHDNTPRTPAEVVRHNNAVIENAFNAPSR